MCLKTAELFIVVSSFASIASGDQCFCPVTFDPVCASNGHVFTNACALECYNLENREDLRVIGSGHCVEHLNTSPSSVDQNPGSCYRECKKDYVPIVSSRDRKIYWNDCYRQCDAKKEKNKTRYYLLLLGALSAIECIIVFVTKYIRRQKRYLVFE